MNSISRRSLLAGAACTGLAMTKAHAQTNKTPEWNPVIALGGLPGFDKLSNPAALAALRHAPRFKLYIHNSAWLRLTDVQRHAIISSSGSSGVSPDIELGGWPNPRHWFDHEWKRDYAPFDFRPRRGHVNANKWDTWDDYVDVARNNGFLSLSPVVTPNHGQFALGPLSSGPSWERIRQACQTGGGITADIPVDFYFAQPGAYRAFIADELIWAKKNGLWATAILSPGAARGNFQSLLEKQVADLTARGAFPDEFVIENYSTSTKPGRGEIATSDCPNSLNHAAIWLMAHTQT